MNESITSALSAAVDQVNKLIEVANNPDESRQLHCLREMLFDLWEAAIKKQIDANTPDYTNAIVALQEAEQEAKTAQDDLSKIGDAIQKAVSAAKAADKVIQLGLQIAKFFQ